MGKVEVDKDIIIYAFRYTLGRASYAPSKVMDTIKENIEKFSKEDLRLLMREIEESHSLGMEQDKREWELFVEYLEGKVRELGK